MKTTRMPAMLVVALAMGLTMGVANARYVLSGRVYSGEVGDHSTALSGVTVGLYGASDSNEQGTILDSTTTDPTGWYGLDVPDNPVCEFYNIVETDPPGYISVGATAVSGTVKSINWIQYANGLGDKPLTGNKFWDKPEAPLVDAGSDQVVACPDLPCSVQLAGQVTYDSLPTGDLWSEWIVVSGAGLVELDEHVRAPRAVVTFHEYDTYVLRLIASDGQYEAFDDVAIEIKGEEYFENLLPQDLNRDGCVNIYDFALLASAWLHRTHPVAAFGLYDFPDAPTVHVPGDVESIGGAIMELSEDGRVVVAAGVYRENIEIQPGARIIIQAEGSERPELFAAEPELPVVHVAPKAKLCLIGMSVHGIRSGLVTGSEATGEAAHALTLSDTHIADAEYGIYGLVEQFHIERSSVENNVYGLAVAGSASLVDTTISGNTIGVVLSGDNTPSCPDAAYSRSDNQVLIQKLNVSNNKKCGIAICNVSSATVNDTYVHKNAHTGVQILNTPKFLINNLRVGETQPWNGQCGDGLVVVHSSGIVKNSQFSANKRANIIYYGNSAGPIDKNLILYATFALHLGKMDGGIPKPVVTNNYMYGNKVNKVTCGGYMPFAPVPSVPPLPK